MARDRRGRVGEAGTLRVLVTGASGYVGGRLVPALLGAGVPVRCLARTPAKLDAAAWHDDVEVVAGSVGGDLQTALAGVDVAVYLVHSIGQGGDWVARELDDARSFARSAAAAHVRRIVYLGGLGDDRDRLSEHLRSRHAVGQALASTGVEVVELRAGVIIGSGSASFEMLRYLVETLPVMVTPRWVRTRCQPIAITDVVRYLVGAVRASRPVAGIYEIGGPDVVSYAQVMDRYAQVAGLPRRFVVRVPVLTPALSSYWVGLVTPVPVALARDLVESLVNEVVVRDRAAERAFGVRPMGLREAIDLALNAPIDPDVQAAGEDGDVAAFVPAATDPDWSGGTELRDVRTRRTSAPPERVFAALSAIGGANGWYASDPLWQARGLLDQLLGGPGLRRGRKATLAVGDPLDFWRVAKLEPTRRLQLYAEMRLPGEAWLDWDIAPSDGGALVTQTAVFRPRGLSGRLYWLTTAPFHRWVFPAVLDGICARGEDHDAGDRSAPAAGAGGGQTSERGDGPR